MKAKIDFSKTSYSMTPDMVDRIVCFRRHDRHSDQPRPVGGDGAGLLGIDRRKFDVFLANDVPELAAVFKSALEGGVTVHDIALVVRIPKEVRKARTALLKPE